MKIGKNDLDQQLVQKIERLDSVVDGFIADDKAGFLSYDGSAFLVRRVNDSALRRVFSESELSSIESRLYDEGDLVRNSFRSDFNTSNQASSAFRSFLVRAKEEVLHRSDSPIVKSKRVGESQMVFINRKGMLVKIDTSTGETLDAADIRKELASNFAVPSISAFEFLDIEGYGNGVLLSTSGNGVLFYDFASKKLEVKFNENGVTIIRNLGNGTILCAADRVDGNVMFFSFETGMKLESSNALRKRVFQAPALVDSYKDHLFVVGRPYASSTSVGLLHYWKKDAAGISFSNADQLVFPGIDHVNHSIKHLMLTEDNVYVSGTRANGKLFVWQYDLKDISSPYREISFDKFSISRLDFVEFSEEFLVVGEGNRLYFLTADGSVEKNIVLDGEIGELFFSGSGEMVHVSGSAVSKVRIPQYNSSEEITLEIYKSDSACNNIDVVVKGCSGGEKFAFFDTETLEQIAPFYMATVGDRAIVKISGSRSKSISMKLAVKAGSSVEGVAVRADRLFLK